MIVLVFVFVWGCLGSVDFDVVLNGRVGQKLFQIGLNIGEIVYIGFLFCLIVDLNGVQSGCDGYVGDGIFVGDLVVVVKLMVQYVQNVLCFIVIVGVGVWIFDFGFFVVVEIVDLIEYWFQFVYLLYQLLDCVILCCVFGGQELVGFVVQIDQYCVGFEQVDWLFVWFVWVDYCRDFVIGVQ